MKIIAAFLSLILLSFVAVQYNDPDPWLWMPIYGYGAVVLALSAIGKYNKPATIVGLFGYGIFAAYYFPSVLEWIDKENGQNLMQRMEDSKIYIEETRECGGLIISFIFLGINYAFGRNIRTKKK